MRYAISQSLPRGGGPARGAAALQGEVIKVGGVAGDALNRGEDRLRRLCVKLNLGTAAMTVHVAMRDHLF